MKPKTVAELLDYWDNYQTKNPVTGLYRKSPIYALSELGYDNDAVRCLLSDPLAFAMRVQCDLELQVRRLNDQEEDDDVYQG